MPSHSHGYQKFKYKDSYYAENKVLGYSYLFLECDRETHNIESSTTESKGNSQSHNNMPPYLTANCWKRLG